MSNNCSMYVSSHLQRTHFAIQEGPLTAARALLSFSFVLLASNAMESSKRICWTSLTCSVSSSGRRRGRPPCSWCRSNQSWSPCKYCLWWASPHWYPRTSCSRSHQQTGAGGFSPSNPVATLASAEEDLDLVIELLEALIVLLLSHILQELKISTTMIGGIKASPCTILMRYLICCC